MKKMMFLSLLCSLMLLTSCKLQFDNVIEPSNNIVSREYTLKRPFDKVDIDVIANVKFLQIPDSNYRVVLSCPDNYVELFKFNSENSELEVEFVRNNVNIDAENVDITIYAPSLRKLENDGVASVEIDRLAGDELKVENSGVGKIYVQGLKLRKLDAECSGVGGMELAGEAEEVGLECSGVGGIDAMQLKGKYVQAEVSGVGSVKCFASESIKGTVSGVGSLTFGGHPHQQSVSRTGVGGINEE